MNVDVQGDIEPGFESIADVFSENFSRYGDMGANFSLVYNDEVLVDIWAGNCDRAGQKRWQADTRSNIFSAGKPFVAVAALQQLAKGELRLDEPIADIWPAFAANNKERITLRQVLSHRSGVNAFHQRVSEELIFDWSQVTAAIAAEAPWWEPGAQQGYSPLFFGWILAELVKRCTGDEHFNDYFQREIAAPLSLSMAFGVAAEELDGIADNQPNRVDLPQLAQSGMADIIRADPRGVANRAFGNPPTLMLGGTNTDRWRQAQIPAANGQAKATDVAKFYGSLASDDERLLSQASKPWCWQPQSQADDVVLMNPITFALGFINFSRPNKQDKRFGHPGAGGTMGYGDADHGLGLGYVTRNIGQAVMLDYRADRLLQASYDALGLER